MKKISFLFLSGMLAVASLKAQNIFPANGRVGIYTTTPAASLQVKGGARIGTTANYLNVDSATGNLSFVGTSQYKVANNAFAFTSAGQPLAGLYFNATNVRYEFRNTTGTPAMVIGANATGNVGIGTSSPLSGYKLTVQSTPGGIAALSGSTGVTTALSVGRAAVEADFGVAAGSGNYFNGTVAGDGILRVEDNSKKLVFGAGIGVDPAMVVTNSNVGIGTTTPFTQLSNTSTNLLGFDGYGLSNTSLDWQSSGFGYVAAFYNPGSGAAAGGVVVRIHDNAGTVLDLGASDTMPVMTVKGSGNVGIGTAAPAKKLDVNGDASVNGLTIGRGPGNVSGNTALGVNTLLNNTTGANNTCVGLDAYPVSGTLTNYTGVGYFVGSTSSASNMVELGNSSVTVIRGQVNFSTYSDERIKKNIKNNVPGLAFINLLKPVTYNIDLDKENSIVYKNKKSTTGEVNDATKYDIAKQLKTGFLAQDVEAAAKKLNYDFSGVVKPQNENDLYSLRYSEFVVPLVKAVQELSTQNSELKSENEQQQQINADLQNRLSKLEALISAQTTSSQNAVLSLKAVASLQQNAPNPFSNSTVISYTLPQHVATAQIIITNMQGNIVKTANVAASGSIAVAAGSLLSGTYNYSLVVDGKIIDTKTMVLTK